MSSLQRIATAYATLVGALAALAGVIIAADTVLIVVDVTIRTLGVPPPAFTIAVVEYSLLYVTMFAAPWLVRQKGHVVIDALITRLPEWLHQVVARFAYLVSLLSSLVVAWFSWQLFIGAIQSGLYEERGIDMPLWSLYLPIPIGFVLVAVEFARYLLGRDSLYRGEIEMGGTA